jgi:hypothetical protein
MRLGAHAPCTHGSAVSHPSQCLFNGSQEPPVGLSVGLSGRHLPLLLQQSFFESLQIGLVHERSSARGRPCYCPSLYSTCTRSVRIARPPKESHVNEANQRLLDGDVKPHQNRQNGWEVQYGQPHLPQLRLRSAPQLQTPQPLRSARLTAISAPVPVSFGCREKASCFEKCLAIGLRQLHVETDEWSFELEDDATNNNLVQS